ncbi:MAG: sigma-54-dependent Fis family transcriptional regulator [Deltaproteobacteria bacterium]|nr:sigma-54-dependent Fis family transcriptional regulator [Deltaproteobacteria bacterium]
MESIPEKTDILVVDDDEGLLASVRATLMSAGMPEPGLLSVSGRVMGVLRTKDVRLVLLDLIMPEKNGMEVLQVMKETFPSVECIVITAVDDVSSAVRAMRFGAFDYLVKPVQAEKLLIAVSNALERYHLRQGVSLMGEEHAFSELRHPEAFRDMVAVDPAMAPVFRQAELVATTDYNLLITGETGTGKEMLARIIHSLSLRSKGPFVAVNMASMSNSLFEDALFGHTKGAFTGATRSSRGFFEAAQGGTIFLDEITELEPYLQGKLLRLIEEKELYLIGSTEVRPVNLRIIAASNRNISREIKEGRFRDDLFYRLGTFHILIPPLRKRKNDVLPLAAHFLKIHALKNEKVISSLSPEACERLRAYAFPGNVRELENIIAGAVVLEREKVLSVSSLKGGPFPDERPPRGAMPLSSLHEAEKAYIMKVLEATGGNRTQAARILGIGLRTLQRKLKGEA